jgi:hypothetical protein
MRNKNIACAGMGGRKLLKCVALGSFLLRNCFLRVVAQAKDGNGRLYLAMFRGSVKGVVRSLNKGADLNARDAKGQMPLMWLANHILYKVSETTEELMNNKKRDFPIII